MGVATLCRLIKCAHSRQHFKQHKGYSVKLGTGPTLSPQFHIFLDILHMLQPTLFRDTEYSRDTKKQRLLESRELGNSWTVTMCIRVLKALGSSAPNKPFWLDSVLGFQNLLAHGTPYSILCFPCTGMKPVPSG
ncbi:PREDICTED: LOW QUALITY PROTEIN: uncharacterized protein C20orf197 homolog [Propithecus coquereli]|uniref:LOW QUALITY PROTEIN: uncharacterized protein C20orf197 homolog n=1 Tax=Propithecus coquereli TaxID=379532 RepID=UPI00063EE8CF|nr:PREDICTED: LOW QUALITY PROTEIN: uncharacterized protein C20orf197 homolog [Propithecus coquereli]